MTYNEKNGFAHFFVALFPVFRCPFCGVLLSLRIAFPLQLWRKTSFVLQTYEIFGNNLPRQGVLRSSAYDFFNDCGRALVKGVENHLFCAERCKAAFAGGLHKKDKRPISFATFFRAKYESHAFSKLRSKYYFASDGMHSREPQSLLRRNLTHRTTNLWGTKTVKNSTAYPICRRALALP